MRIVRAGLRVSLTLSAGALASACYFEPTTSSVPEAALAAASGLVPGRSLIQVSLNGAAAASDASVYDFQTIAFGNSAVVLSVAIRNGGAEPLEFGSPAALVDDPSGAGFALAGAQPSGTLAGGAATSFTVRFTPATLAAVSTGTLRIRSNDPDSPEFRVGLSGGAASMGTSLFGYYRFENNIADSSPLLNGGFATGTVAYSTDAISGVSVEINEPTDAIDVPHNGLLPLASAGPITVAAWIKIEGGSGGVIFDKSADSGSNGETVFAARISSTPDQLTWVWREGLASNQANSGVAAPANEWVFCVWEYDSTLGAQGGLRWYLNGVLAAQTNLSASDPRGASTATQAAAIGRFRRDDSGYFTGKIDELRVYRRTLSPAEVQILYRSR